MQNEQFTLTCADGTQLFAQLWQPEQDLRAVVCLVHGVGEHSGRYAHVATSLSRAGYALVGFDLRGHGHSPGPRGYAPSFKTLLDDTQVLLDEASRRYPQLPRFLYGHSLGSTLVLNYVLGREPHLAGAVATGSVLRSSLEEQRVKLLLVRLLGRLLPALTLPTGLDPSDLSRDPEVIADYVHDPLVHDRLSLGLAREILVASRWALERAGDLPIPLLLMHGAEDTLGSAEATREFGASARGDCTVKLWEGLKHEVHNEPEQEQVIQTMIEWMDAHLP